MTEPQIIDKIERLEQLIESVDRCCDPKSRLAIMAQNAADNHHWSRNVGSTDSDELLAIFRLAKVMLEAAEEAMQ